MAKFKKGSAAAKAYMASIRKKKGTTKKAAPKKARAVGGRGPGVAAHKKAFSALRKINHPAARGSFEPNVHYVLIHQGAKKRGEDYRAKPTPAKKKQPTRRAAATSSKSPLKTRQTGFSVGGIVKTFTISELKQLNPLYFAKGTDKMFGVVKRKLVVSKALNAQFMIEKHVNTFGGERVTSYSSREIKPTGELTGGKSFDGLLQLSAYLDKSVKF